MKCSKCGMSLPNGSEFCQYCGVKVEFLENSFVSEPRPLKEIKATQKCSMSRIIALIAVPIALVSIIYNVVQYQFATDIQAEVEKLQQDYSAMVENNDSSKEDIMELNNKISKLISEYKTLEDRYNVNKKMYDIQKEYLDWYEGHIALINNFNGNCAYHTISCSKLDDTFYIFAEKEAIDRGCWECEVCHLY